MIEMHNIFYGNNIFTSINSVKIKDKKSNMTYVNEKKIHEDTLAALYYK